MPDRLVTAHLGKTRQQRRTDLFSRLARVSTPVTATPVEPPREPGASRPDLQLIDGLARLPRLNRIR